MKGYKHGMRLWREKVSFDDLIEYAPGEPARAADDATDEPDRTAGQPTRACYTDCLVGTAIFAARRGHG